MKHASTERVTEERIEAPIAPPLSELHQMLTKIGREHHARRLNRIANDPSVYPLLKGYAIGPLDLTAFVANPANVLLMGEHGGVFFICLQPGIYEAHTQVLPTGRGAWTVKMVRAALHWMFCHTDAVEIMTRCPTVAAKALAVRIGGRYEFTNPRGWVKDLDPVPADIYALRLQDWAKDAPGLEERGHWFHERLEAEFKRHGKTEPPHPDDDTHDRYVGLACEMFLAGQPQKGVVFYNRWAALADYAPIKISSLAPLTIDIASALIIVRDDGDFWVPLCR